jgi:PAS domain S-box-containing protein
MAFYKAKMDKTLREREEWLSTILKSIGDGVIATDNEGQISFMNPLAERLSGWAQSEVLRKPLSSILPEPDPSTAAAAGPTPVIENVLTARNGGTIPIEQSVSAFIDARKNRLGSVLIFRDITRRKQAEAELRASRDRLQKALAGTIQAMGLTIEMRDPYTAGHQRRVSKLSCAMALDMGLPAVQIEGIRMAGDIHDLGKIYVPAEILSKPGQLTEIEFSIIRTHSQVGYDILKSIEFPWPLATIIYQHHERLDGSGYPNKLKGADILLEARIICVADVVEAMSSHRPYRPSHGVEKALEEITRNRGRLYDEAVVDSCLKLFREKGFSFD